MESGAVPQRSERQPPQYDEKDLKHLRKERRRSARYRQAINNTALELLPAQAQLDRLSTE